MKTHKLSISLPEPAYDFMLSYLQEHQCKSYSEVIITALRLLQQLQLEEMYAESNKELAADFDYSD